MKKKLYILGMVMTMGIACMGCGKEAEVTTDNTEAATETVAEVTTEAATKEKTTNKKDKTQKTTEDTFAQAEDDNQPDKTQTGRQGSQRTTEAANRQTTGSASTQQPTTQAPVREQPTTQQPTTRPDSTPTTEAPTTTVCQHHWEEIMETIHHDAVMGTRCAQSAVIHHWWCRNCQCSYPELANDPCGGANGGTADITVQEAVYEQYEAVPAYDEQVGTGRYRCTRCGATK